MSWLNPGKWGGGRGGSRWLLTRGGVRVGHSLPVTEPRSGLATHVRERTCRVQAAAMRVRVTGSCAPTASCRSAPWGRTGCGAGSVACTLGGLAFPKWVPKPTSRATGAWSSPCVPRCGGHVDGSLLPSCSVFLHKATGPRHHLRNGKLPALPPPVLTGFRDREDFKLRDCQ